MTNTDIIVIGSGPAGITAANCAASHGAQVTLLDEQTNAGGQIYRGITHSNQQQAHILGADYVYGKSLIEALQKSNVNRIGSATVWSVDEQGEVTYSSQGRAHHIRAEFIIIATGAIERPYPVPSWTLPGVMTVGAAQILIKNSALIPENAILAGTGPLLYTVANQLLNAGATITAIVDTVSPANYLRAAKLLPFNQLKPLTTGLDYLRRIKQSSVPFYRGATQLAVLGSATATGIRFQHKGMVQQLESASVLLHQGIIPNTQLSRSLGLAHRWHPLQRCFHPLLDNNGVSSNPRIRIAGDGAGIGGALCAEHQGSIVALGCLKDLGLIDKSQHVKISYTPRQALLKQQRLRSFLDVLYAPPQECIAPEDSTIICRCEEVTAGEIRQMARLGCDGPNQTKSLSRCGMGPCQGRYCGLSVTEILAAHHGKPHDEIGAYRIRTPIKPVTLAELASLDT